MMLRGGHFADVVHLSGAERRVTANQYKVVLSDHLYPAITHFYPNVTDLFQDENATIHRA